MTLFDGPSETLTDKNENQIVSGKGYRVLSEHGIVYIPVSVSGEWNPVIKSGREFFAGIVSGTVQMVEEINGYWYDTRKGWAFDRERGKLSHRLGIK
jgi:hypothetical protein